VWAMGIPVCGMYQMLTRQEMHVHDTVSADIWLKSVPLKVSICVWRLHRNSWPTKDNLVRRDIIADDSPSLELFGSSLGIGLVFLPRILIILTTTSLGLLILQEVLNDGDHFCS
jgi:hypothetical protein